MLREGVTGSEFGNRDTGVCRGYARARQEAGRNITVFRRNKVETGRKYSIMSGLRLSRKEDIGVSRSQSQAEAET